MTEIQVLAANAALTKMLSDGHFSICTVDKILKITGGIPNKEDYDILNLLHCVDYKSMSHSLRSQFMEILQRVIGSESFDLEVIYAAEKRGFNTKGLLK